jgi:hypothetical protein
MGRGRQHEGGEAELSEPERIETESSDGERGGDSRAAGSVISPPHAPPHRSAYMCAPAFKLNTGSIWKYFSPLMASRASPLML